MRVHFEATTDDHPGCGRHERNPHCNRPYRSRDGWIFGVCAGLANYWGVNAAGLRFIAFIALFFTGFWPMVIAYIIAAFIMKPAPVRPIETEEDAEFYNSFTSSKKMALHRLKRTYDNLDRRIQRIEDVVTAKEYDWDRRLGGNS